jgi:PAS domain S-box-containing protein
MRVRILAYRLIGLAAGATVALAAEPAHAAIFAEGRVDVSIAAAVTLFLLLTTLGLGWALRREILQRLADEERIRDFASTASDWYWETDAEHRFTFMSRRTLPVGVSPDSRLGRTRREFAADAALEPEKWEAHYRALARHAPFRDFTYAVHADDGTRRYLAVSGRPIFDRQGKFIGYRGTGTDVTDRHLVQQELHVSHERYDIAVRQAGIWDWDLDTNKVYYSPRFRELLGYDEQEFESLTSGSIRWLVDPNDWARCVELLRSHLRSPGTPYSAEHKLLTKDRGYRWFHLRGQAVCNDLGKCVRMAGILTDIDDRRRAEARLLDAIDNIPDGLCLWDADGRLVLRNEAIVRMDPEMGNLLVPGISLAEFITRRVQLGRITQAVGCEEAYIKERIERHRNPTGEPFVQKLESGRWVRLREQRTREGGVVSIRTDITPLKQREADLINAKSEAETANRAKSEFLASMSHELRTPLNAIIGFSDLLRSCLYGSLNEKQGEYLNNVHESGHHLLELINDILDVSKVEAGRYELYEEIFHLAEVIGACATLIGVRARDKEITVHCDCPSDLPRVRADQRALKQVILNLLTNAVKFNVSGGRVTVAARLDPDGSCTIEVKDTGIGISRSDQERIFMPFQQADPTISRKFEGTGLGLWISKALIELHDGTLAIDSKIGEGTTVTARLPAMRVLTNESFINAAD